MSAVPRGQQDCTAAQGTGRAGEHTPGTLKRTENLDNHRLAAPHGLQPGTGRVKSQRRSAEWTLDPTSRNKLSARTTARAFQPRERSSRLYISTRVRSAPPDQSGLLHLSPPLPVCRFASGRGLRRKRVCAAPPACLGGRVLPEPPAFGGHSLSAGTTGYSYRVTLAGNCPGIWVPPWPPQRGRGGRRSNPQSQRRFC